jgi:hypothetical protein
MSGDPVDRAERLAEMLDLPAGDPRREEFERSPANRALLKSYRAFLTPGDGPPEADRALAKTLLDARIDRELGLGSASAEPPAPVRARAPADGPRPRPWWAPALRPAFAFATLAVVGAGVWFAMRPASRAPGELRGREVTGSGAPASVVTLRPSRTLPGGALELSWEPVAGAEGYEVRFFATDLSDLARIPAGAKSRLPLDPAHLPAGLHRGAIVLWQVAAQSRGAVIATSEAGTLRIP